MNKIILTVILLAFSSTSVLADPISLRNNINNTGLGISLGYKETTISTWLYPNFGLSAEVGLPFDYVSASLATRFNIAGSDTGFGIDGFLGTGITAKIIEPGAALNLIPSIRGRYRNESFTITTGIVSPTLLQFYKTFQARIPVLLEVGFIKVINENSLSVGLQASGGPVFVPGLSSPSYSLQGSLLLNFL